MSTPVFGREPSRPLPKDDESDPTQDIDVTDNPQGNGRASDDPDRTDPAGIELERDEADRDEPGLVESEVVGSERDEADLDEAGLGDTERDEAASVVEDDEEAAVGGEASATRFARPEPEVEPEVEPVVLDAEGVSAEPEPEVESVEPVVPVVAGPPRPNGVDGPFAELQLQFVDDPQAATAGALRMLREALAERGRREP